MPLYVITYDERVATHNYQPLYNQLNEWKAAHLQNSVWLAELKGPAPAIRDILRYHAHPNDTICVIEIFSNSGWATVHAKPAGAPWLHAHCP